MASQILSPLVTSWQPLPGLLARGRHWPPHDPHRTYSRRTWWCKINSWD